MYGHTNQSEPSQPEWRLPPRRPVPQPETALPPPPPRPPAIGAAYSPANFGPISGSPVNPSVSPGSGPASDPRAWGVRYNQQVHPIHAPPPLPPRPASTNEQPYAYAQPQQPVANPSFRPPAPGHGADSFADALPHSPSSLPPPYTVSSSPAPVPPPPPKIPQGYQNPPVQQSSPSPRPPLQTQSSGPPVATGPYGPSPPTSLGLNTASLATSSALGPGTPSDWEHFGPTPAEVDDAAWFPPRRPASQAQETVQTPPGFSTGFPNPGLVSPANSPSPRLDTTQHIPVTMYSNQGPAARRNDSISPISPDMAHGVQSLPARTDSVNSGVSFSDHAESIDNVIDAWVRPLSPANQPAQTTRPDPASQPQPQSQCNQGIPAEDPNPVQSSPPLARDLGLNQSPAITNPEVRAGTVIPKEPDPYEDLDPWFKSSLSRYVAMLRKEAVADSDEERYKIFTAFMSKETKLREILYNIEPEAPVTREDPPASLPTQNRVPPSSRNRETPIESGLIPVATEELTSPSSTTEDGNDDDAGSEYSAGGRPILGKQARRGSQWIPNLSTLPSGVEASNRLPVRESMPLDEAPQKQALGPLTTNPPRPIYTPFQYTEGPQRGSDNLSFDRPAYQAYSDLRQASAVSGRVMSNAPPSTSRSRSSTLTTPAPREHDETFLGLIRHKSTAYQSSTRRNTTPLPLLPESLRQGRSDNVVEDLRSMVWTPLDKQSESSWHITTREDLEKFPDDFSYIQKSIDDWEDTAKGRRQRLDEERTTRQEDSEAQIDSLFNGKEIGYADINTLEEDFRQSEARVQLDEERQEVENFISQVFNPLDERLKDEISALRKSYDSALNQLDRDQKGKQCSPSVTMKMVNEIHNKLEIRFQKRLEIALDCERRRKKAERRPLVFMGDMGSLRKLDGDFNLMEKRNILEAAKDRDERANRLMDSFDDAILHGLGMNQSHLDELASKAAQLDPTTLRASGLPDSEVEQILKSAATFAASLRADSEAIIRSSGVADMILNDADYNISVAEARYANSEPEVFQRLEVEKRKEDEKIQSDQEAKLQSIQKGPEEIDSAIQRLLQDLRETPRTTPPVSSSTEQTIPASQSADVPPIEIRPATASPGPTPALAGQIPDPEMGHQERLRIALENAKKRNAARNNQ
ncbi:uncharacterized protein N7459_006893 [Penicillium hispanicum]|uniref:uncharacterized protein n=1 Tax=Penicillium hispanicum TaxID=1080232 RepID=UPI00254040A5|nr:uncharacterized protein N7459_006893 [Penicillium hispanicum]KAJ5577929.1 hypothetical protein N7459_006893 [Penicillium hispanicum]